MVQENEGGKNDKNLSDGLSKQKKKNFRNFKEKWLKNDRRADRAVKTKLNKKELRRIDVNQFNVFQFLMLSISKIRDIVKWY